MVIILAWLFEITDCQLFATMLVLTVLVLVFLDPLPIISMQLSDYPHPLALKIILILGGIFIAVLVFARFFTAFSLVPQVLNHTSLVFVGSGVLGTLWVIIALTLGLLIFFLPSALHPQRKYLWSVLFVVTLLSLGLSGNVSTVGGSGLTHTPVGFWLASQGYTHCPSRDKIHHGIHSTTVIEAWVLAGKCTAPPNSLPPAAR